MKDGRKQPERARDRRIMKKFILTMVFMGCASMAFAQTTVGPRPNPGEGTNAVPAYSVVPDSTTCSSTTVANVATSMLGTTFGYRFLYVENLSTTCTLFCSDASYVATSGPAKGSKIFPSPAAGPNNFKTWFVPRYKDWYCVADAGGCSAMVCRTR